MLLALLSLTALAAPPRFVAADPALEQAARRAWIAAEACTGYAAPHHDRVEIASAWLRGGYAGGAQLDDDGLRRIVLWSAHPERALVHEVAHAWARSGPPTLNEGRADLLADCIARRAPDLAPLDPDSGRDLDHMPDLRRWTVDNEGPVTDLEALRSDAYLAAGRFLRVVAEVVDPQDLWPEAGRLDWPDVEDLLEDAGPRGQLVLAVLQAGVERQRDALSDRDHDGSPWLAEILEGTDPERWDSDGDGWWDGAPDDVPRVAAVPLPRDGTPVCSGLAGGRREGAAMVLARGALRGRDRARVEVWGGDKRLAADALDGIEVPPGVPLLLRLGGDLDAVTGGMWALAGGQGLVLDWNCRSTPRATVWVDDPVAAMELDTFVDALLTQLDRVDAALNGPGKRRTVVVLGASHAEIDEDAVHISTEWLAWARAQGRIDALAAVSVALHRVWEGDPDDRRWDTAEALTRLLVDDPPDLTFVAVDLGLVDRRAAEIAACGEGWKGALAGGCPK